MGAREAGGSVWEGGASVGATTVGDSVAGLSVAAALAGALGSDAGAQPITLESSTRSPTKRTDRNSVGRSPLVARNICTNGRRDETLHRDAPVVTHQSV